jgi:hypothetical protein
MTVEQFLIQRIRLLGGTVMRVDHEYSTVPDLVVAIGGGVFLVDIRHPEARPTAVEALGRGKLAGLGSPVYVLTSAGDVISWLRVVTDHNAGVQDTANIRRRSVAAR